MLEALGPEGILINVARGSVVDEPALIARSGSKRFWPPGSTYSSTSRKCPPEFLALENVVLLPHLGSASLFTREKMDQLLVDNILAWAKRQAAADSGNGNTLAVVVSREARYSAAMRTSGAAARTSASTWSSNWTKFFWNIATSLRAVWSNSSLFCQVFCG